MSTGNVALQTSAAIAPNNLLSGVNTAKYGDFKVTQSADGTKAVLSNKRYEITIDSAGGQRNVSILDKLHQEKTVSTGDPHLNDAAGNRILDYKEDLQINYPDMEVFIETTPPEKSKSGVPVSWAQTISIKDDAGNVIQVEFGDPKQRKKDLVLDVAQFYGNKADEQMTAVQQRFEGTVIWEDGKDTKKNDGSYGSSSFYTERISGDPVSTGWLKKIEANNTSAVDAKTAVATARELETKAQNLQKKAEKLQNGSVADKQLTPEDQAAFNKQKEGVTKLLQGIANDPDTNDVSRAKAKEFLSQLKGGKLSYRQVGMFLALIAEDLQKQAAKAAQDMGTDTSKITPAQSQRLGDLNMDIKTVTDMITKFMETQAAVDRNLIKGS